MSDSLAQNPYAVPTSNLQELASNAQVPTIEEALARGYNFNIGDLLSESWQKVKGTKGLVLGGFLIYYVVMLAASTVLGMVFGFVGLAGGSGLASIIIGQIVIGIIAAGLSYPFMAGVMMIGIRRAADQPVSFNEMFNHFGLFLPLLITGLIMMTLVYLGMLLLLIPGIYLSVAYLLALPLVIERGLSPWQALEASRKAISQHWFQVFGLLLVLSLIMTLSILPLGIGLIWTIPLFTVAMGVLYRTIFGVLPQPQ
jgi:hypothetical protein